MKIKKDDLFNIIDILKQNIDDCFQNEIDIKTEDFYWEIPEDMLFDPTVEPNDLTLGQLDDDWEELLRLNVEDSIPLSYDLKRLSIILQIIRKKSVGLW